MSVVSSIADGIERQEGYYPGSLTYRDNNPLALWDGIAPGKPARIWPDIPIDSGGFLVFPDYASGRSLGEMQLAVKVARGMTLRALLAEWSNTDGAAYTANVAAWSGLPADVALNTLDPGSPDSAVEPGTVDTSELVIIGASAAAAVVFLSFFLSE